jgi:hypothetical protein
MSAHDPLMANNVFAIVALALMGVAAALAFVIGAVVLLFSLCGVLPC